jgi:hypothetical protein
LPLASMTTKTRIAAAVPAVTVAAVFTMMTAVVL